MTGQKGIPLPVLFWMLCVAEDQRHTATSINVAAYLARHADETGAIGTDANGRPIAEPKSIAEAIGLGKSTVFKALSILDSTGAISITGAVPERFQGIARQVRLNLPDAASE